MEGLHCTSRSRFLALLSLIPSYPILSYPFLSKSTRNTTTSPSRYRPTRSYFFTSITLRLRILGIGSWFPRSLCLFKSLFLSPCPVYSRSVRNRDGRLQPFGLARHRHHRPIVHLVGPAPSPYSTTSNAVRFPLDTCHHGESSTAHHGYGSATYN
jgi:hypothetical protein